MLDIKLKNIPKIDSDTVDLRKLKNFTKNHHSSIEIAAG